MKERGIIFDGESVRGILAGLKRQTRRVMRRQPHESGEFAFDSPSGEWDCFGMGGYHFSIRCPYGVPGDRLWVRETMWTDGSGYCATKKEPRLKRSGKISPIYMPRHESRITLDLLDVRVERVQDMSVDDVRAEGYPHAHGFDLTKWWRERWRGIHGDDPIKGWNANPWIWALTFQAVEGCG